MGLNTPSGGGGAPTDAAYVTGSSNSELSNETVVSPAGDILVSDDIDGTVSLSPGFGTYTQVSSTAPALLTCRVTTKTDGSTSGSVRLDIDESGGTTADYSYIVSFAGLNLGSNAVTNGIVTVSLPAGAQFRIRNSADPNGNNQIRQVRAQILSP